MTLGSGLLDQLDEPQDIHAAMALGGPGGAGGATGPSGQAGGAPPSAGAPGAGQADAGVPGATGEGDDLLPNGENGLMLLADYAAGKGEGPKDQGPGAGSTGGETGPQDVEPALPGTDSFQVAQNDPHGVGGGFGFGGGGAGGGGGSGGSGGGGGGDGSGGGTPSKPGPGESPPAQTTPPGPGGGDGGGPVCVLAAGCDLTPPDTSSPPKTTNPTGDGDPPILPPRGEPNLGAPGAIPEPASWLMMIVGFMGLGAVLRAQRRKADLA